MTSARAVTVGGAPLDFDQLDLIASGAPAKLAQEAQGRMEPSRALIQRAAHGSAPVYGVNTGFGALKSVRIPEEDVERLQANLVRSHAAGMG
ncbi:MAG TPA: aromatic amino acid lyase, partial [Candidatus Nitrosocosmicus sp.]|nr:aromatic amino acid lyase [Candidatus Nitrosocosmicus sp.]